MKDNVHTAIPDELPKTEEGKNIRIRGKQGKYNRDTIVQPYRVNK